MFAGQVKSINPKLGGLSGFTPILRFENFSSAFFYITNFIMFFFLSLFLRVVIFNKECITSFSGLREIIVGK